MFLKDPKKPTISIKYAESFFVKINIYIKVLFPRIQNFKNLVTSWQFRNNEVLEDSINNFLKIFMFSLYLLKKVWIKMWITWIFMIRIYSSIPTYVPSTYATLDLCHLALEGGEGITFFSNIWDVKKASEKCYSVS